MDMKVSSTLGFERRHNELLAITQEDEFVDRATASLRPQPPNLRNIVALNQGPLWREPVDAHPLTPRQIGRGALVIDVRTALQFDEAHIPGAVSNTILHAGFGTRLAWIAGPEDEIVLVGRDDADALHATELAAAVGLGRVAGYLAGGMTSWREERLPTRRIERLTVPELHERAGDLQILDVRERDEWDAGHIPGSRFAPYHDIHALPEGLDRERPIAVICASGQRAAVGASLVQRHGAREVLHVVDGGVPQWVRNGWPVVR
jgi:rhodanese-related sulfurtransferase